MAGYTLSAGRAERHWRDDESTTIAALENLGLARDDVVAKTLRSPKQVEMGAKARGLKVPSEFIVSTRFGTSLTRVENAHAPVPGRGEIVRSFSAALKVFQGEAMTKQNLNPDPIDRQRFPDANCILWRSPTPPAPGQADYLRRRA